MSDILYTNRRPIFHITTRKIDDITKCHHHNAISFIQNKRIAIFRSKQQYVEVLSLVKHRAIVPMRRLGKLNVRFFICMFYKSFPNYLRLFGFKMYISSFIYLIVTILKIVTFCNSLGPM